MNGEYKQMFNGYRLYVTDQNAGKPKKEHIKKPDQKMSYHLRVQKKWIKRFGLIGKVVADGQLIKDDNTMCIFMNVETFNQFIKAV